MDQIHLDRMSILRVLREIVDARLESDAEAISRHEEMITKSRETIARTRDRLART